MTQQTNAQRRSRGLRRLEVWLPAEYLERLDALCAEAGDSRAELVQAMIDAEAEAAERTRPAT